MATSLSIVWFRQDLRLADNPALVAAVRRGAVVPAFVWAPEEDGDWPPGAASRWWLHHSLASLDRQLTTIGSRLTIRRGSSLSELESLVEETGASAVFWNRRYEPAAIARDAHVKATLLGRGVQVESFNGSLLHEPWTVATKNKRPFQIFTPFWKACQALASDHTLLATPTRIAEPTKPPHSASLDELQLLPRIPWDRQFYDTWQVGAPAAEKKLAQFVATGLGDYPVARDRIDGEGLSRMSPHLHFGEISPRQAYVAAAVGLRSAATRPGAERYLAELGWREFAYHLLYHFPRTVDEPLRANFGKFPWSTSATALARWQRGQTGYPIVDAAMRDLWATGFMPNRARMIVASFLAKDLLLPWQQGARWFWDTLVDADLANNTLGWQWSAGCGADAAPYFRIFNPVLQGEKFDPVGAYVRRWLPELAALPARWIHRPWEAPAEALATAEVRLSESYPRPIIDHGKARDAALAAFAEIKGG